MGQQSLFHDEREVELTSVVGVQVETVEGLPVVVEEIEPLGDTGHLEPLFVSYCIWLIEPSKAKRPRAKASRVVGAGFQVPRRELGGALFLREDLRGDNLVGGLLFFLLLFGFLLLLLSTHLSHPPFTQGGMV